MNRLSNIIVAIYCIAYNQESYIRDCLDGFIKQQTNFRFVAIVHDDNSTDSTTSIIKEYATKYPDLIKPIFEIENQYSKRDGSLAKIMNRAIAETGAKYIAFCEGDDYWIDFQKLQKQVDYLDTHPNYDLYCSSADIFIHPLNEFKGKVGTPLCEEYETCIQGGNDVSTPTAMVRVEAWNNCIEELSSYLPADLMFDTAYWYYFAYHKRIKYTPEPTAVYRVLENSASHASDYNVELKQQRRFLRLKLFFLAKYPLRNNHQQIMDTIMRELNMVIDLSRLCGERKVQQSKTYQIAKRIRNLFRK